MGLSEPAADASLVLEELILWEEAEPFSLRLAPGSTALVLTPKEEVSGALTRVILGLTRPRQGRVVIFGRAWTELAEKERNELRRRIGVVYPGGGLVANLKAWENLLLPPIYHKTLGGAELTEAGRRVLERVGYRGPLMALPGLLSGFQRKQIGLARTLLMEPQLLIYDALLTGLNQRERQSLLTVVRDFQQERPGRCSLHLSADPGLATKLPEAEVFDLRKGSER